MDVAFKVFVIPKADSKSGSVPHVVSPSFKGFAFTVFPAEVAAPVESMMPFSNGKLELSLSKYPKLAI